MVKNSVVSKIISECIDNFINEITESSMVLYHGTPHDFIKFQNKNIGTGEGSQCFGWGLYFTSNKDVATFYADLLRNPKAYVYTVNANGGEFLQWYDRLDDDFKMMVSKKLRELGYDEIPYRRMLVKNNVEVQYLQVEEALDYFPNLKFLYENLSILFGSQKKVSELLNELGFIGIKYPIGTLRNRKVYGFNYVFFNGDDISVKYKEEI